MHRINGAQREGRVRVRKFSGRINGTAPKNLDTQILGIRRKKNAILKRRQHPQKNAQGRNQQRVPLVSLHQQRQSLNNKQNQVRAGWAAALSVLPS